MSRGLKRLTGCFVQSIGPSVIAMRGEVMSLEFISCAAWLIISGFGVPAFGSWLWALGVEACGFGKSGPKAEIQSPKPSES